MKKLFSLLFLTLVIFSSAFGQLNLDWVNGFGDTSNLTSSGLTINQIRADAQGYIYVTGSISGIADIDPSASGTLILSSDSASFEFFLAKFSPTGSLIWANQFHRSFHPSYDYGFSSGWDLKLDIPGNIYVCGDFNKDHITSIQGIDTSWIKADSSELPAFFAKFNADGDFLWAKSLDVTDGAHGGSINIDPNGFIYLFGQFSQTIDLDPGPGVYNITGNHWEGNAYISKYDTSGNFIWGTYMRGGNNWTMRSAINSHGDLTITGFYADSLSFPNDPQFLTLYTYNQQPDGYLIQFSQSGKVKWIKSFSTGGIYSAVESSHLSIDSQDNIIISGAYHDTIELNPPSGGAIHIAQAYICESFFAKYDSMGNYLWSNVLPGDVQNFIDDLTVSSNDEIYITGYFVSNCDMNPSDSTYNLNATSMSNYIGKYTSDGKFIWATKLCGSYQVVPKTILLSDPDKVLLSGRFMGTVDFDLNTGIYNLSCPTNVTFGFLVQYNEGLVGIEKQPGLDQPYVFPNPGYNQIRLNTDQVIHYEIFNALSIKISAEKKYIPGDEIDISALSPGVYFIRLFSNSNQHTTLKFVKL